MSTYKVPTDVEAEDRLIWIFSFRQLIFLLIAGVLGFAMVMLARVTIYLAAIPLPFFILFVFLGVYRRADQPIESYVSAILRFWLKPRRRIWDRDGIIETVIINIPKKVEKQYTDNLSRNEVKNRLKVLGSLMDSRGWSAKNSSLQASGSVVIPLEQSDRLVVPTLAQTPTDVHGIDDMFDYQANPTAQKIDNMTANMQSAAQAAAVSSISYTNDEPVDLSGGNHKADPLANEPVLPRPASDGNLKIENQDADSKTKSVNSQSSQTSTTTMTTDVSPDILKLANNNDRNVESLAKEADNILEISHDD